MNNTRELLSAVKQRHGLTTDYQLAKFLGISRQRISGYQSGANTLGGPAAIKVADALELDRGRVLAIIAAERAQSEQEKKEWLKLAAAVAAVAAVALFAPDQLALLPASFDAISAAPSLYIMSSVAALLAAALAAARYRVTRAALALAALLALPISESQAAEPWDTTDKALAGAALALTVADWGQTRYVVKNPCANIGAGVTDCTDPYYERNPILGSNPSLGKVDRYFAGVIVGGAILAHQLPPRWRKTFLGTVTALEFVMVGRNRRAGIGFSF